MHSLSSNGSRDAYCNLRLSLEGSNETYLGAKVSLGCAWKMGISGPSPLAHIALELDAGCNSFSLPTRFLNTLLCTSRFIPGIWCSSRDKKRRGYRPS